MVSEVNPPRSPVCIVFDTKSLASSSVNFPVFTRSLTKLFSLPLSEVDEVEVPKLPVFGDEVDVVSVFGDEVDVVSVFGDEVDVVSEVEVPTAPVFGDAPVLVIEGVVAVVLFVVLTL